MKNSTYGPLIYLTSNSQQPHSGDIDTTRGGDDGDLDQWHSHVEDLDTIDSTGGGDTRSGRGCPAVGYLVVKYIKGPYVLFFKFRAHLFTLLNNGVLSGFRAPRV